MDEKFQYQPLPRSDGLRILHLEASKDFASELVGTLSSVPFSAKPAYVALSYTWKDRDVSHAMVPLPASLRGSGTPFLRLRNTSGGGESPGERAPTPGERPLGARFPIGHNLALALLHLRPRSGPPLPLWIDQVCINQIDNAERAAQVALMSFIYQRTRLVVCWLGVAEWYGDTSGYRSFRDIFSFVDDARRNETRLLPGFDPIPHGTAPGAMEDLRSINDMELYQLPANSKIDPLNPYWQRIWIVQEVCLAPRVVFMQGPYACDQVQLASAPRLTHHAAQPASTDKDWIQRLVEARAGRFSDAMRLEALVERFRESGCHELRDKLFALVGLANDAWAVAGGSDGVAAEKKDAKRKSNSRRRGGSRRKGGGGSPTPEPSDGRLSIDYERSFFDIWCEAVKFFLEAATPIKDFCEHPFETRDEREAKVVRFAGILQQAFAGKVQEEMTSRSEIKIRPGHGVMTKGYIAGRILHLGPSYDEYIGSHLKHSQWLQSWSRYYTDHGDLGELRKMEEQFSTKIIEMYTDADVARVKAFEHDLTCAILSPTQPISGKELASAASAGRASLQRRVASLQVSSRPPRRFLGSDLCMGMVAGEAQVGDVILRFWNCDAAVVASTTTHRISQPSGAQRTKGGKRVVANMDVHTIIGRADVAELTSRLPQDARAKDKMGFHGAISEDGESVASDKSPNRSHRVDIYMDFVTLQKVSEAIVIGE
ncbi:hypothetical protein RB596_006612 [Gaeumannomyces avenae]